MRGMQTTLPFIGGQDVRVEETYDNVDPADGSTLGAVAIAAPVGLAYDGTAIPVATAAVVCSTLAWLIMGRMK